MSSRMPSKTNSVPVLTPIIKKASFVTHLVEDLWPLLVALILTMVGMTLPTMNSSRPYLLSMKVIIIICEHKKYLALEFGSVL